MSTEITEEHRKYLKSLQSHNETIYIYMMKNMKAHTLLFTLDWIFSHFKFLYSDSPMNYG